MKKIKAEAWGVGLITVMMMSCSHHPTQAEVAAPSPVKPATEHVSIETQQVAAEQKSEGSTEIQFPKKKAELTAVSKGRIQELLNEAMAKGSIKDVKVITWADEEYPSVNTKKLSKQERDLVTRRNNTIKKFIDAQKKDIKVQLYSMAERPSVWKEMFGSSETRIKKSLETAGIPNTDTSVKEPAKASKAVLLVEMKDAK